MSFAHLTKTLTEAANAERVNVDVYISSENWVLDSSFYTIISRDFNWKLLSESLRIIAVASEVCF